VHDARARGHHPEVAERLLPPFQKLIALAIALELDLHVAPQSVRAAELVHLHRMVYHQLHGLQRINLRGVAAHPRHRVAHGRKVHHAGNACEVLQKHPRGREADLLCRNCGGVPVHERADVAFRDGDAVLVPQQVLQQNAKAVGEALQPCAGALQGFEAVDVVVFPSNGHRAARAKAVTHQIVPLSQCRMA